jgi:hypothetical protein
MSIYITPSLILGPSGVQPSEAVETIRNGKIATVKTPLEASATLQGLGMERLAASMRVADSLIDSAYTGTLDPE